MAGADALYRLLTVGVIDASATPCSSCPHRLRTSATGGASRHRPPAADRGGRLGGVVHGVPRPSRRAPSAVARPPQVGPGDPRSGAALRRAPRSDWRDQRKGRGVSLGLFIGCGDGKGAKECLSRPRPRPRWYSAARRWTSHGKRHAGSRPTIPGDRGLDQELNGRTDLAYRNTFPVSPFQ